MPTLSMASSRTWIDTVDPTVNDDDTAGYEVGNKWFNSASGQFFNCCSDATGAAIWDGEPTELTLTTSWVPSLTGSTGSTGITYTTQIGYYQRVNNLVTASFYILLSSAGTASGTVSISSFPIANNSSNISAQTSVVFTNCTLTAGHTHMFCGLGTSSTDAAITEVGSGVQTAYDFANVSGTSSFSGTLIYEVD
jgi:hypothetical protein